MGKCNLFFGVLKIENPFLFDDFVVNKISRIIALRTNIVKRFYLCLSKSFDNQITILLLLLFISEYSGLKYKKKSNK